MFTKLSLEKKEVNKAKAKEAKAKDLTKPSATDGPKVNNETQPAKSRRGRPRKTQNAEVIHESVDDLFDSLESSGVPDSQL